LTCTDGDGNNSGCSVTSYRIDFGAWQAFDVNILFTDGNRQLDYNSTDVVGNIETTLTTWVAVDKNVPATSITDYNAGWQNSDQNIILICSSGGSGCSTTSYRIDAGAWTSFDENIWFTTDGNFQLDYNSTSGTGVVESINTVWVAVDKTTPAISNVVPLSGSVVTVKTVSFDLNDTTSEISDANVTIDGIASSTFSFGTHCVPGGTGYHCTYTEPEILPGANSVVIAFDDNAINSDSTTVVFNFNIAPDVNLTYPNTTGIKIGGVQNITFDFVDEDFNINGSYDFNLSARRLDTNASTAVATDKNAFAYCTNMDSNLLTKTCTFSYDFSSALPVDVDFVMDVNIADGFKEMDSNSGSVFQALKVLITERFFSRLFITDLDEDGVNFGVESEAWLQAENKSKEVDAVDPNSDQILVIRTLNDNSSLEAFVNLVSVGTIDANASDPQSWQWYAFNVSSALLTANAQNVKLVAGGAQATTYVDWIGFMHTADANIVTGGGAVGFVFDVNGYGTEITVAQMTVDQNGVQTVVDFNLVQISNGDYLTILTPLQSLDQNLFAWLDANAGTNQTQTDQNKTVIIDSTNPAINSITMHDFNVVVGEAVSFDSNITETYFTSGVLEIEGIPYDLNKDFISSADWNAGGSFTFASHGDYSCVLFAYDAVDRNDSFGFTIKATEVTASEATTIQDTNWSRTNAVDINSTAGYVDIGFRTNWNVTATGTATITDYNITDLLNDGHDATGERGSVKNVIFNRSNKANLNLASTTNQIGIELSDINESSSFQDYFTWDVNNSVVVQYKNTGAEDNRLVNISSIDHNTDVNNFWVKMEIRTPFAPATYKVIFKECTTGADFGAGTCTNYTAYNIYDESDSTFNGGVYPTVDSDDDGLKDTLYFKVSNLSSHMYSVDLTGVAETAWAGVTPGVSDSSPDGSSSTAPTPDTDVIEGILINTGLLSLFDGFSEAFGSLFGGLFDWLGLQADRLAGFNLFSPANLFTVASFIVLAFIAFILLPRAEARTKSKSFGLNV